MQNDNNITVGFVKVRYFASTGLIEADVTSLGIDYSDNVGKDFIVNFQFENMDTGKTFYTDSNGLEMQTRVLNHRNTWNFTTD